MPFTIGIVSSSVGPRPRSLQQLVLPATFSSYNFDLSDTLNTSLHLVDSTLSIRGSLIELAKPFANLQPFTGLVLNNQNDTVPLLPVLSRVGSGTTHYLTNVFGNTNKPGVRIANASRLSTLFSNNSFVDIARNTMGDMFGPSKSVTVYIVFQQPNTTASAIADAFCYINGSGAYAWRVLTKSGNAYQIIFENTDGTNLTVNTGTTNAPTTPRVFGFSIDSLNKKLSYADSALLTGTEITLAKTPAIANYDVATADQNTVNLRPGTSSFIGYIDYAEMSHTPGYTNPAGLIANINQLKLKWSIT